MKDEERDEGGGRLYRRREKRKRRSKYGKIERRGFTEYFNLGNIVKSVCYCWTRCLEDFKTEKRGIIIN